MMKHVPNNRRTHTPTRAPDGIVTDIILAVCKLCIVYYRWITVSGRASVVFARFLSPSHSLCQTKQRSGVIKRAFFHPPRFGARSKNVSREDLQMVFTSSMRELKLFSRGLTTFCSFVPSLLSSHMELPLTAVVVVVAEMVVVCTRLMFFE